MSIYDKAGLIMVPSGYKADKLYSVLPASGDGDFVFSRGSTATRVNSAGKIEVVGSGVPRLDYSDGDCPALLLEPARTNMAPYSEQISNWGGGGSVVADNVILSPTGEMSADKITATGVSQPRREYFNTIPTSDTTYTFSVFAKRGSNAYAALGHYTPNAGAVFNLDDGIVVSSDGCVAGIEVLQNGNGWCRIWITLTVLASAGTNVFKMLQSNGASYSVGVVDEYVYYWGAQIEEGAYPTSYIPTADTAVTRAADICNGAGNAAMFNSEEGVLFVEMAALADDGTSRDICLSNADYSSRFLLKYRAESHEILGFYSINGVASAYLTHKLPSSLDFALIAFKAKTNDFALWINGVKVGFDGVGVLNPQGTFDKISFDGGGGSEKLYGKVRQLMLFNEALSDAELTALTTP